MIDPITDMVVFMSGAFILGLALGWAVWKLAANEELAGATTETEFWQQQLNEARQERDLFKTKIEILEEKGKKT